MTKSELTVERTCLIFILISLALLLFSHQAKAQMIPFAMWQRASANHIVAQQAYVKASTVDFSANHSPQSYFGYSIQVDADTLAVGAYQEDSSATGINGNESNNSSSNAGAVYIFTRSGVTWTQQAYIKASNTGMVDYFGFSVSVSGDTLAVGAYLEDSNVTGINGNESNNSSSNAGAVYIFTRSGVTWTQQAYIKASNTGSHDYFGYSVSVSGDTLAVGASLEDSSATGINGDDSNNSASESGAVYIFTRSGVTWSQQAYIKASNTEVSDYFGSSVSVSGDTLAVGAYQEDSNATGINGDDSNNSMANSGAAYVFIRSGAVWSQQAYIKASNTGAADYFGFSVSVSGDTLAVGAYQEGSNATGINGNESDNSSNVSGAVYVFTRSGVTWSQQAYIKASNTEINDSFGRSVSVSGDTLAVGAYLEDSGATGINGNQSDNSSNFSGAVYVFTRSGAVWSQQAYIKASNTDASDYFGFSVSVSGDTLAVGASGEDSNATGINGNQSDNSSNVSGAVYVFTRSGAVWSQQAYVKASTVDFMKPHSSQSYFGYSIQIDGDTLAVGASQEDSGATGVNGIESDNTSVNSGAVYVFTRSGTVWSQQAYIKASNTNATDSFGDAISISGDTLAVGAYQEDSNATGINGDDSNNSMSSAGAVYVFTRSGVIWSQQAYIKASNTEANDYFGFAVSVSGDTLAVGANGEDSNATGINGNQSDNSSNVSGAVYVFTRSGVTWTQQAYIKASNTEDGDGFGRSVSVFGDTLAVGAPQEDSNATGINGNESDNSSDFSGAVYVFTRSGVTWTQQAYIKASNTGDGDNFGQSVSVSGDTLAVGAYLENSNATGINGNESDNSSTYSGAVYVFTRSGVTWTQQAYIKASNTGSNDYFGQSVSVSGDTLAVGAYLEDSNATGVNGDANNNLRVNSGAVYVFTRTGVTWSQQAYIKASNSGNNDFFGRSLSVSGDTLAFGAYGEGSIATGINGNQSDNTSANSGAVYVFTLTAP